MKKIYISLRQQHTSNEKENAKLAL